MNTTNPNPRTPAQNRTLYGTLNRLGIKNKEAIADIVWEHTNGRTRSTSELQFIECMTLINSLQGILKEKRLTKSETIDAHVDGSRDKELLDRKRKGLIKAIFRWYELQGMTATMDYVKGTACKAAGVDYFNQISPEALSRLYAEFCKKQQVQLSINNKNYPPICDN